MRNTPYDAVQGGGVRYRACPEKAHDSADIMCAFYIGDCQAGIYGRIHSARLLGAPGDPADFLLFDPDQAWLVTQQNLWSKSANTPWLGRELRGRVRAHWLNGLRIV